MEGQARATSPATMPNAPSAINAPLYRVLRIPVKATRRPSRIAYAPKRRPIVKGVERQKERGEPEQHGKEPAQC